MHNCIGLIALKMLKEFINLLLAGESLFAECFNSPLSFTKNVLLCIMYIKTVVLL